MMGYISDIFKVRPGLGFWGSLTSFDRTPRLRSLSFALVTVPLLVERSKAAPLEGM
jgi:hypothetical protein